MLNQNENEENSPPLEGWQTKSDGVVVPHEFPSTGRLSSQSDDGVVQIKNHLIKYSPITNLPFNPNLKDKRQDLRYAYNLPEVLFWNQVKKHKFHKIDFDRQRVIGNYIVDFYIKKLGLVIEIDGFYHIYKGEADMEREKYLITLGLKIFRIPAGDILKNMNFVLLGLEDFIIKNYGCSIQPPRQTSSATPPVEGNLKTAPPLHHPSSGELGD